jgi:hypothetical protein
MRKFSKSTKNKCGNTSETITVIHKTSVYSDGSKVVTDCTRINKFMKYIHFKMEGIPTLKDLVEKKEYEITFNLKKAYNHI